MAVANGPDVLGLLHDNTSYGVYGDHGGTQESVQRIPIVFWSKSLQPQRVTDAPMRTVDIMPTILRTLGITPTGPMDGRAWNIGG
ncbi:MAG TPA: hypothetical protein VFL59_03355, partial [Candidatus Nanopelagicales bacterium]|nr:hypothetical protein [Candidatus Nanopelagicales bacterium]